MGEEERRDIANCISSILTSSTKKMTIKQLNDDFMNTVGYRVPYHKFECSSLEEFLRTLNNKVQVIGYGPQAEVQVIVNAKTAHINELIAKQRIPKAKPGRNSYNRYYTAPNRRRFFGFSNNYEPHRPAHNYQIIDNRFTNNAPRSYGFSNNTQINNEISPRSEPNIEKLSNNNNILRESTINEEVHNEILPECNQILPEYNERLPESRNSTGAIPKQLEEKTDIDEIFFSDDEENSKVPHFIQDNLRKLISKHPDGIWCSNMIEFYRKEYGQIFSFNDYGYRSVAQMCADLRNIFSVVQLESTDIKLFDKNKPIPRHTLNIVKKLQLMKIKASIETPTNNAIPESAAEEIMGDIYSNRAPEDVVQFGTVLEQQWIDPGTSEQDYIDVNVGEVYDPSKFWINLKSYAIPLNKLMDSMQTFYETHKQELQVPYLALRKDMYVVCIFMEEYHRAKIVDVSQKHEHVVKVYFVDYGTVSVINIDSICYLHNTFSDFPEQAIRARLAGIFPPTENEQWSRAAASRFLSLVMQKDLVAQIIKVDEERKILDIVLADTSEADEDFFINDALVHMGYGIFTFQVNSDNYSTSEYDSGRSNSSLFDDRTQSVPWDKTNSRANKKSSLTPSEIMQILRNNK